MDASGEVIDVLHVDDDPDFATVAAKFLEREDERLTVETATNARDGLDLLERRGFDCVVSDYDMPGLTGIEFLEAVREKYPDLPFILYTGKGGEEVASDAISAGVTDYLQKTSGTSQYAVLANRIENSVEKYRVQQELTEREKRLDLFVEQSPFGVIRWDENFDLVRMNDAAEEILGYTEADLRGRSWHAIVPESDREAVDEVVTALLEDKGGYHSVNENVRKDGERIVCEWRNRVVTDDDGGVVAIFSQFQDVTERVEREEMLERERDRYSGLFENMPNPVVHGVMKDGDAIVQDVNTAFEETFGYDAETVVGDPLHDHILPEGDTSVDALNRELLEQGKLQTEVERQTADGVREFRVDIRIRNPDADAPEGYATYTDITERKENEQRLEALNETTQELMTAETRTEVAEYGVDAASEILNLNANGIYLYDDDAAGLVPVAYTEESQRLVGDLPTFTGDESIAWRVYQQGEARAIEDVHEDPDIYDPESPVRSELLLPIGEYGLLLAGSSTPAAFDQQDRVLGEILASNIATALEQVERTDTLRARTEELSHQNERLAEFAGVVSHDLRNPLQVATTRLELAQEDCESPHLDHVADALERSQELIDDLLTLAREGEELDDIEAVPLAETAKQCWANVATTTATLVTDTDRTIRADRNRLQQLLENLIGNAIEHGGEDVTVTMGDLEDGFYVEDDGPGIPADERDRIFETGYSTSDGNTGFGLTIVGQIADAHGWTVTVAEGSDGGARFEITGVDSQW